VRKARMARVVGAIGALGALSVVAAGGGAATAETADSKPGVVKVKAEFDREEKRLYFDAPAGVAAGDELQIKNNTNPRTIGPHTFSLVREEDLPSTNEDIKTCSRKFKGICGAIARWHEVNLQTGEVGENPVDVGKQGWDRKGSLERKGDSWFTGVKGEKFQREVTAEPGTELYYICAVHAEMQGKLDVYEREQDAE
jgi:plastocyanin